MNLAEPTWMLAPDSSGFDGHYPAFPRLAADFTGLLWSWENSPSGATCPVSKQCYKSPRGYLWPGVSVW